MPSARNTKHAYFENEENSSEVSNKDDLMTESFIMKDLGVTTLQKSDSSEDVQANPFGNHIRVSKSPVPPLRIPQAASGILLAKNLANITGKFGC